jgi:hypothetical protein
MLDYPVPDYEEKARMRRENEALKRRIAELERNAGHWRILLGTLSDDDLRDVAIIAAAEAGAYVGNASSRSATELLDAAVAARAGLQGEPS